MTSKPAVFTPHSHKPYGADGSGFYTDNTIGCFNVIETATPLTLKATDNAFKKTERNGNSFNICDYGTADGGTSMLLIKECVEFLKKVDSKLEILVQYEDQPNNDFKSVFLRLQGLIPGPPSYLLQNKGVFINAVGTGFYQQCVPSNSVHMGMSFTAMHWLRKKPCSLTGCLHHSEAAVESEKEAFAKQAANDWEDNLLFRAKELAPGAQMIIACFTIDDEGQLLGQTKNVKEKMFPTMTNILQGMVKDDKITQEEFENTNFNNYYRTQEEFLTPFKDTNSKPFKAGLRLVSIETKLVRCPYHLKWINSDKKDDMAARKSHAKWFIPTIRTWSNGTIESGLSSSRSAEERTALTDEFYARYEQLVAENPQDHGMDYVHAYILFEKI